MIDVYAQIRLGTRLSGSKWTFSPAVVTFVAVLALPFFCNVRMCKPSRFDVVFYEDKLVVFILDDVCLVFMLWFIQPSP